ncbi:hypothetical protein Tco_1530749 [Tanacetum coccineum]
MPQATKNNHAEFEEPPELTTMIAFHNELGYAKQIRLAGQFIIIDLPQPWQKLEKILMRCLLTREIGVDQPPLHMIQMFYCIINNVHVDYAALIWEGLHYSLMRLTKSIPYPSFTKIIIDHILTEHPDIPKRFNEPYHRAKNDEVVKSILNYGKRKERGMWILEWLLTKDMKQTTYYKVYATDFQTEVPMTQRRQPDPETLILKAEQIDIDSVDEATRVSIATSRIKGDEIDADKFDDDMLNSQEDPDTRIDPEKVEEESVEAALIRKKGKGSLEIKDTPIATPTRSPMANTDSLSSDKEKL